MEQGVEVSPNAQRAFRQAPLVGSVSCYCNVDAGLRTVAGARKFVPGSKICIQPDFNARAHKTKNSCRERNRVQPPLLPGLPNDLAIACLIRSQCRALKALPSLKMATTPIWKLLLFSKEESWNGRRVGICREKGPGWKDFMSCL